jgi:hypothetical protein
MRAMPVICYALTLACGLPLLVGCGHTANWSGLSQEEVVVLRRIVSPNTGDADFESAVDACSVSKDSTSSVLLLTYAMIELPWSRSGNVPASARKLHIERVLSYLVADVEYGKLSAKYFKALSDPEGSPGPRELLVEWVRVHLVDLVRSEDARIWHVR